MRIKRYFGFSLILFIMIFSISFASADEISDKVAMVVTNLVSKFINRKKGIDEDE